MYISIALISSLTRQRVIKFYVLFQVSEDQTEML